MVPGFAQKATARERSTAIRGRWDFFLRSVRSLRRGRVFTDGGGREWRKPFGIPTERPGLQLGESYGSERQVRGRLPQAAWRESRSEIHWEGANQMDSDGEGWCRGDFVAGLGTRFVGRLRGSAAAPIEKSTGGMTSVSSDFCGPAAPVKQHIHLEKIIIRPGDGASRLKLGSATARQPYQFGTMGSRRTRHRRGSAYRREMVGMPRRRRPTFAAWPPLSNNTSNSKRSSSARETALRA